MKRHILVLLALAVIVIGVGLPLNMVLAKGPTAGARTGILQVQARAGVKQGTLKNAVQAAKPQIGQQFTTAQAADSCANDTPDDQEVKDSTDTDNVELQCGDQSGPDEQVEDASGGSGGF